MSVNTRPYLNQTGYTYNEETIYKFGYNPIVGTDAEDIWDEGGTYTFPSSAGVVGLTSSNSGDTSITIFVSGLDENYDEASEIVTLDGTNPQTTKVDTQNQYIRINRMYVTNSTEPTGDIYAGTGALTTGKPANLQAKITAGENQTLMAIWTVPRNYTAYITSLAITTGSSSVNKFATVRMKIREFGQVFRTQVVYTLQNTALEVDYPITITANEKADIKFCANTSSGSDSMSANFSIIYKKNS